MKLLLLAFLTFWSSGAQLAFRSHCSDNADCLSQCCHSTERHCAYSQCIDHGISFVVLLAVTIVVIAALTCGILVCVAWKWREQLRRRSKLDKLTAVARDMAEEKEFEVARGAINRDSSLHGSIATSSHMEGVEGILTRYGLVNTY